MDHPLSGQLDLPPIDQVGFVYNNLEQALALYQPLFGKFDIQEYGEFEYNYRGVQEKAELRIAFGYTGELQIELIEWVSGGTPHKEFLDAGREGMHHIRFPVDDLDTYVTAIEQLGYESIWSTRFGEGLAVAYMEKAGEPLIIELFENLHGNNG